MRAASRFSRAMTAGDLDVRQGSLRSARLINGDYERRCRAATAIADACFDAQLMLSEILNLVDARA